MRKSTIYLVAASAIGLGVLAMAAVVYRGQAEAIDTLKTAFTWGFVPAMALQAWLLIRMARCVGREQRPFSIGAVVTIGAVMLIGAFLSIGVWTLVLLQPMLDAATEGM